MAKFSHLLCLTVLAIAIVFVSCSSETQEEKDEENTGKVPEIGTYELKTKRMHAKFTNWGATLMSFYLPDKNGKMEDVVLGFDKADDYKNDTTYFGAIVGRVANRIGGAKFTLNGKTYKLDANDGKNTLHGGTIGFSDVLWTVHKHKNEGDKPYITFTYESTEGEEGFPGKLKVRVTYKLLSKGNALTIKMTAKPGKEATPVNLAHHTYWNLGGHNSGDILSHSIQISGSHITQTDSNLIPTGEIAPVVGTPYDFQSSRPIGTMIGELSSGYDINYCLDHDHDDMMTTDGEKFESVKRPKAMVVLEEPKSGRRMEIRTNQKGLQFYTGGQLMDVKGKEGAIYKAHAGLALETQGYPDAVNHDNFPSQIVKPGEFYEHLMVYKFSILGEDENSIKLTDKKEL